MGQKNTTKSPVFHKNQILFLKMNPQSLHQVGKLNSIFDTVQLMMNYSHHTHTQKVTMWGNGMD